MSALIAGRYRLEAKIASGGMGEVWTARDQTLGRRVAVKLLRNDLASDPIVAERFKREALTAASLSHPNMADVYDYVEENGRPGIVMEMVEGETLAERLRRGRLEVGEAVRITTEVLDALATAHEGGIVHRDVKPGNIMITPKGTVKVTDFGIARAQGDSTLTETGAVMGTAHYAAPEQVQGRGATPASDLYSTGIVLYEALTGTKPFEAETPVAAALARLTTDPPRPRKYRPEIPSSVEAATMRSLAREPSERYPTAAAMREALTNALAAADTAAMQTTAMPVAQAGTAPLRARASSGDSTRVLPAAAPLDAPPPAAARRRRRWPAVVAILVAIGVLTSVAGLVLMFRNREAAPVSVATPRLQGLTLSQAIAETNRLNLRADPRSQTSNAPADTVISQSPAPGTPLAEGALVVIVYSKGPPSCCTVPNLIGMDEDEARAALQKAGLRLGDVTKDTRRDDRDGTVISQSPAAGKVLEPGSAVDIVIAKKNKGNGGNND